MTMTIRATNAHILSTAERLLEGEHNTARVVSVSALRWTSNSLALSTADGSCRISLARP